MAEEKPYVLIVDDELSIRESFNLILSDKYKVIVAASGEAAIKYVTDQPIALVYLDIRMPGMNGIETLKKIKEVDPQQEVIMVTAVNDVKRASEAIKLGAHDYVVKPFDVKDIQKMTEDLIRRKNLLKASQGISFREEEVLIGTSEKIIEIKRTISKIKNKKSSVLILGEEGVEKEKVARALSQNNFFCLDLKTKKERLEDLQKKAKGGTLFLDHIECLQDAKLELDFRLICGTSVNLKEIEFSKELFERISDEIIELPPLRERLNDINILAQYFLEEADLKYNKNIREISEAALDVLVSYDWPGNLLELESLIENLVMTEDAPILCPEDLPLSLICSEGSFYPLSLEENYARFEKDFIDIVIRRAKSDNKLAAEILGIKPVVLEAKLS